jgi:hypothetical protein
MGIDGDDEQEHEEQQLPHVHLTLSNIRSLTTLLQAMKISAKQVGGRLCSRLGGRLADRVVLACWLFLHFVGWREVGERAPFHSETEFM